MWLESGLSCSAATHVKVMLHSTYPKQWVPFTPNSFRCKAPDACVSTETPESQNHMRLCERICLMLAAACVDLTNLAVD